MMALSTPPWDLVPFPWLGLALLAHLLAEDEPPTSRLRSWTAGALRGLLFGAGTNLVALRFVVPVVERFTPLPWSAGLAALVLLSLEQGLRFAAAGMLTIQLARRGVPRWLAFTLGNYLGTFLPAVFPWTVATGLAPHPALLQLAELVGERGVAALMALAAGLAVEGVALLREGSARRRGWARVGAAAAIPVGMLVHGHLAMRAVDATRAAAPRARVALLQPSIEATERWEAGRAARILDRLAALTRIAEAASPPPVLVVWTEGVYPYLLDAGTREDPAGPAAILQPGIRGPVLAGLMMRGPAGAYNGAAMVSGGRLSEPYFKMNRLIFGEYVPFGDVFPWLNRVFHRGRGLVAGTRQVRLDAGAIHAVALVCYEDTLSGAVREAMAVGPNLLVNVTNDAWYTGTQESELHLRLAMIRSVEVRRDMVRAVNLGETTWVDAAGRVRARYSSESPGVLPTEPALLEARTLYARVGDVPLLLLSVGLAAEGVRRRRRPHRPGDRTRS
jgi:apolipoprotein N-acyltransferase